MGESVLCCTPLSYCIDRASPASIGYVLLQAFENARKNPEAAEDARVLFRAGKHGMVEQVQHLGAKAFDMGQQQSGYSFAVREQNFPFLVQVLMTFMKRDQERSNSSDWHLSKPRSSNAFFYISCTAENPEGRFRNWIRRGQIHARIERIILDKIGRQ